jgi:hypothetical protein
MKQSLRHASWGEERNEGKWAGYKESAWKRIWEIYVYFKFEWILIESNIKAFNQLKKCRHELQQTNFINYKLI